jgi:hypothetical protein
MYDAVDIALAREGSLPLRDETPDAARGAAWSPVREDAPMAFLMTGRTWPLQPPRYFRGEKFAAK